MFLLLRFLLWLAVIGGVGYLVTQLVPKAYVNYVAYALVGLLLVLTIFEPKNEATLAALQVLTIPLKPFGLLTILLLNALRDPGSPDGRKQLNIIVGTMLVLSLSYFPRVICQRVIEHNVYELQSAAIETPPGTPEAIVLLGWQTTDPTRYGRVDQFSENGDLVAATANLFFQGQAPRIIISAGQRFDHVGPGNPPIEAYAISRLLQQRFGVPANVIIIDDKGLDIRNSARNVNALMEKYGIRKDIVLVSTALSAYRAMETFHTFDIVVTPRPAGYRTNQPAPTGFPFANARELLPTVEGMEFSTAVLGELTSSAYYFLRGWLSISKLSIGQLRRAELPMTPAIAPSADLSRP